MNKKFFYLIALGIALAFSLLTGCNDDDGPAEETVLFSESIYVLNSGKDGSNNATLSRYNPKDGAVTKDIFEVQNGRRLGDTGQDLVVYGNKMYIAMYGESTVEVTDLEAKSLKQIRTEGQPRDLAVFEGKVYVTYFNGYVARIDTTSLEVETKIQVGRNPDQLTVANGKLYVANSGGLDWNTEMGVDKTVSVIDIASFTETKKIEVMINPTEIESDRYGNVYVVSMGNYGDIPNTLQKIDAHTGQVAVIDNGTIITTTGNSLYAIYSQWGVTKINYYLYDVTNQALLSDHFIGATEIPDPYKIHYDMAYEHLLLTTSDYINDGDVYVFDRSNTFINKFEVGLNPIKAVYVKKS